MALFVFPSIFYFPIFYFSLNFLDMTSTIEVLEPFKGPNGEAKYPPIQLFELVAKMMATRKAYGAHGANSNT